MSENGVKLISAWPRDRAIRTREIIRRLGLCECGTDAHWRTVRDLLVMAESHGPDRTDRDEKGFYRDDWHEFGAKVLDSWNLMEHGTGIGWAWLTEDGKLLLDFLRDFGTEPLNMETGEGHPFWASEFSWTETKRIGDSYSDWVCQKSSA